MRGLVPLILVLATVPSQVAAQAEAAQSALELQVLPPKDLVAIAPSWSEQPVSWKVTFPNQAVESGALASGKATLTWALDCGTAQIHIDNATTSVALEPAKTEYTGVALLKLQAVEGTLGLVALPCNLAAHFEDGAKVSTGDLSIPMTPVVDYAGSIEATLAVASKASGPQKQIPYMITIANHGNARIQVTFELLDKPHGKFNAILPEVLLLEPGAKNTAIFTVATPFHNGYVSEKGDYRVRLLPAAADDPTQTAEPVELSLHSDVHGWYVPGPSPVLLLGLLGLTALVARRRS